jgi:phenylpropionate dioxygenase-like ring-hydroxylating dioxygenase large terminal subunit
MPKAEADTWAPVCRLDQLEPGGALLRLRIGGRRLVAFRLPDGTPGLVQEACAHRCASLVLARSEDGGLRCVYHGWKFAPDGSVLEIPTEPDEARRQALRRNVRIAAYAVEERGGMLWARIPEAGEA